MRKKRRSGRRGTRNLLIPRIAVWQGPCAEPWALSMTRASSSRRLAPTSTSYLSKEPMPWLKREQQVKAKARDAEKVAKEAEQVLREAQTIAQQPNDKAGWMLNWIKTHAAEGLCSSD